MLSPHKGGAMRFFYRSPQSISPQVEAPRRDFEVRKQKNNLEFSFGIRWNESSSGECKNKFCATCKLPPGVKPKPSDLTGKPLARISNCKNPELSQTSLRVLNVLNHWASVYDGQHQGWIPLHHLTQVREDRGLFVALLDSYLRSVPQQGAPILSTARKGSRWLPVRILDEWLEVSWEGQKPAA